MSKMTLGIVALATVGAAAALWMSWGGASEPEREPAEKRKSLIRDVGTGRRFGKKFAGEPETESRRSEKSATKDKRKDRKAFVRRLARGAKDYSRADRKLADAVQAALDGDDFERTRLAVEEALTSKNPDVRLEAVDALGWFGEKAMVDLTKVLTDTNPNVADAARNHLENALTGMEHQDRAFALAASYLELFGDNEDTAVMFTGVMTSAGNQIIDPDDDDSAEDVAKAKADRAGLVDMISGLLEKGGKCAEQAKEVYESIVGEEWSGREAADRWANDIEEPETADDSDQDDADE